LWDFVCLVKFCRPYFSLLLLLFEFKLLAYIVGVTILQTHFPCFNQTAYVLSYTIVNLCYSVLMLFMFIVREFSVTAAACCYAAVWMETQYLTLKI